MLVTRALLAMLDLRKRGEQAVEVVLQQHNTLVGVMFTMLVVEELRVVLAVVEVVMGLFVAAIVCGAVMVVVALV